MLLSLGAVRLQRGDAREAESLLRQGVAMAERFLPPGSLRTRESKRLLGTTLSAQGRYAESEPLLLAAAEMPAAAQADTLERRRALRELVRLYEAWGRPEQARKYRDRLERAGGGP
ncbi:MAG: tetratricopeptide repeat protein [Gemmatimonadales bacterium]